MATELTYEQLALKHAKMKRCKPKHKEGCGQYKELSEFPYYYQLRDQRKRKYIANWCRECQKDRDKIRNKYQRKKSIAMEHTGPKNVVLRLFYCQLLPTTERLELVTSAIKSTHWL